MDPSSTPLTQPTGPFHMAWYARPGLTSVTVLVFFFFLFLFAFFFLFTVYSVLRTRVLGIQVRDPIIIPFPSIYTEYIKNEKEETYGVQVGALSLPFIFSFLSSWVTGPAGPIYLIPFIVQA